MQLRGEQEAGRLLRDAPVQRAAPHGRAHTHLPCCCASLWQWCTCSSWGSAGRGQRGSQTNRQRLNCPLYCCTTLMANGCALAAPSAARLTSVPRAGAPALGGQPQPPPAPADEAAPARLGRPPPPLALRSQTTAPVWCARRHSAGSGSGSGESRFISAPWHCSYRQAGRESGRRGRTLLQMPAVLPASGPSPPSLLLLLLLLGSMTSGGGACPGSCPVLAISPYMSVQSCRQWEGKLQLPLRNAAWAPCRHQMHKGLTPAPKAGSQADRQPAR